MTLGTAFFVSEIFGNICKINKIVYKNWKLLQATT